MLSMLKMQFDSFFNYAKVVIFEQNLAEPNKTDVMITIKIKLIQKFPIKYQQNQMKWSQTEAALNLKAQENNISNHGKKVNI